MITSFFPGRVRLRAEVFKDSALVEKAMSILKKSDAVKNVQSNLRTGSVLLEYYPDKLPLEKLKPLKPFFMELRKDALFYSSKKHDLLMKKLDELEKIVSEWN